MPPESSLEVSEEKVLALLGGLYVENALLRVERGQLQARIAELEAEPEAA